MSEPLNALTFPLHGSRLIEASAGTGKTWTIAALYLRLVLGHGEPGSAFTRPLQPGDILVMTFTRAATRELSDRIRHRLAEAAQHFRGEASGTPPDPFLQDLLAHYPDADARRLAAWRLAQAANSMDDAAIHTIDAWCQRMLREHAFDSGCLFDETLVADETQLREEAVRDYWRQQVYPLRADALAAVQSVWQSLDELQQDAARLLPHADHLEASAGASLEACWQAANAALQAALTPLKQDWLTRGPAMLAWIEAQQALPKKPFRGTSLSASTYPRWFAKLAAWADDPTLLLPDLTDTAWKRLTPSGMTEIATPSVLTPELPDHFAAFESLQAQLDALPNVSSALRAHALAAIHQRLQQLKARSGSFGFADMLVRLDTALAGPQGAQLRQRILSQYPVALVDEFQDTSPLQYRLFDRLYRTASNDAQTALFLIGDPKQSIYAFRGADIHSYLAARQATQGRHYMLGTNFRSSRALVAAVNHWFEAAEGRNANVGGAFRFDAAAVNPGSAPTPALPFHPVAAAGRTETLVRQGKPWPPLQLHHHPELLNKDAALRQFAQHAAQAMAQLLNDASCGLQKEGQPFERLRPADLAVLVRDGSEARAIRRALAQRGLASVYLSENDSVLASPEAADLLHWLRAVAEPSNSRAVRAGLATGTLALPLTTLEALHRDDTAFDDLHQTLRELNATWRQQGVLAMLRQTLHRLQLPQRWLQTPGGERRLTNWLHLAELLQTQSLMADGEPALIRWLADEVQSAHEGSRADEQVVRLESDADLIQVVTVHKSKGLEYPVVFIPFGSSVRLPRPNKRHPHHLERLPGGHWLLQLSAGDEAQLAQERLQEDLRLAYVALTRARHAVWVGVPALSLGRKGDCSIGRSALGSLIGAVPTTGADDIAALLSDLAAGCEHIHVHQLPDAAAHIAWQAPSNAPALVTPPPYSARIETHWRISSYSSLVRDITSLPSIAAQAAVRQDEPESSDDTAAINSTTTAAHHRFPRGALAGQFLHDQLEWLAEEGFDLTTPAAQQRLSRRCERAGWADHAAGLTTWLQAVLHTPLAGVGASLSQLPAPLPEMEFWLPSSGLSASKLDAACRQHLLPGLDRPALPERQLHGMLMGFADLVFEHEGRYWVLDYKSNSLGHHDKAYTLPALEAAMAEHRYEVQALLYLLALHRLLRRRLGSRYNPAQQLGGAVYLFLRGIHGPAQGSVHLAPPLALLEALDQSLTVDDTPPTE